MVNKDLVINGFFIKEEDYFQFQKDLDEHLGMDFIEYAINSFYKGKLF